MTNGNRQQILVDGHVHCHSCFDRDAFFDHAAANLNAAAGTGAADGTNLRPRRRHPI